MLIGRDGGYRGGNTMEKQTAYAHLAKWFEYLNDDCDYANWSQYLIVKLSAYPCAVGVDIGVENFIYLTQSTGIGAGIIASGKLIRGGGALSAGECGHICVELNGRKCNCGLKGCYEAYAGGRAIANRVREELADNPDTAILKFADNDPEKIDMVAVEKAVRANDPYACALWDEMSLRNAQAMGMFINIFNPEKIILGTLAWAVGDLYTDPIKKYLPDFCWAEPLANCEIVSSELKRDIGSYAGIAAALNYVKENAK